MLGPLMTRLPQQEKRMRHNIHHRGRPNASPMNRSSWQQRLSVAFLLLAIMYALVLMGMQNFIDRQNANPPPDVMTLYHHSLRVATVDRPPNEDANTPQSKNAIHSVAVNEAEHHVDPPPKSITNYADEPSYLLPLIQHWMDPSSYVKPSPSFPIDTNDRWEHSRTLPNWMIQYFRWHKEQRQRPRNEIADQRYFALLCLHSYPKCGGLADRLLAIPFLIKVAAQSGRIFIIKWGRPTELEEFLLPPEGGVDWRVSRDIVKIVTQRGMKATIQDAILEQARSNATIIRVQFQSHDHGEVFYDRHRWSSEPSFRDVFRECWEALFTPAPPIAQRVEHYLENNGLIPAMYGAAHLRALYNAEERDAELVEVATRNAINCISRHETMYFASDYTLAISAAADYAAEKGVLVIYHERLYNPLHLDKAENWTHRTPVEFYDTFEDFYLLALSKCVAYGMGSFGKMASYLVKGHSCNLQHHNATGMRRCAFQVTLQGFSNENVPHPLFPKPMPTSKL